MIVVRINGVRVWIKVNHFIYTNPQGVFKVVNHQSQVISMEFTLLYMMTSNSLFMELVKNPFNCI